MPLVAREWPGFAESALAQVKTLGFLELFTHAERGDEVAREVRDRCLRVWAANAVSLIHAYDPEVLILGGGAMQSTGPIRSFVQEYVKPTYGRRGERHRYGRRRWEIRRHCWVLSHY